VFLIAGVIVLLKFTGCMERLFYMPTRGPTPVPADLRGAESVRFPSFDGTMLHGWFIPARGGEGAAIAPTILHAHGNAGNITSHVWFTEHLPPAGFNVFIFDYRGYGESGGAARSRSALIMDTIAALDYLLTRPDIDLARIGLYGQSLGGAIGLNAMAQRREIRAAVIESPFSSWREMAASALGGAQPNALCRGFAWLFIGDDHRADEAAARIDRPILLLHGDADTIIPIEHSRRIAAAAPAHVKLIELPGGEHNSLRDSHPFIDTLMIDFLAEHLANRSAH
jgi:hypothetical protein